MNFLSRRSKHNRILSFLSRRSRHKRIFNISYKKLFSVIHDLIPGIIGIFSVLVITGGNPSGFTIGLLFFVGTAFLSIRRVNDIIRRQQIFRLNYVSQYDTSKQIVISVLKGWKQLDADARAWLFSVGKSERILKGEHLIFEGTPITSLYIVLKGALEVRISALPNQKVATLRHGDVVGEMSFVKEGYPPSASVIALEDSCVWSIPCSQLLQKLKRDKIFAARFYKALAGILAGRLYITTVEHSRETGSEESEKILRSLGSVGIVSFSPTTDNH